MCIYTNIWGFLLKPMDSYIHQSTHLGMHIHINICDTHGFSMCLSIVCILICVLCVYVFVFVMCVCMYVLYVCMHASCMCSFLFCLCCMCMVCQIHFYK